MKERFLIGAVTVIALACIGLCTLAWTAFQQSQQVNAAILTRLESLSSSPDTSLEWTELNVVLLDEPQKPVTIEGFTVSLSGNVYKRVLTSYR